MARGLSQSILLPDGQKLHIYQRSWESRDEFLGRALCVIEQKITGLRVGPTPIGTKWFRWDWDGEKLTSFCSGEHGVLVESTGEPYQNRTRYLPGSFSLQEARKHLGVR